VCNEGRNVVGLMPHPERACDDLLGSADGVVMLQSLLAAAGARV
jgi:phosphoribosylformylglycinamidine (FGAM) synthase-like amidotransferase family enzyme